jgi:hypothetical protein
MLLRHRPSSHYSRHGDLEVVKQSDCREFATPSSCDGVTESLEVDSVHLASSDGILEISFRAIDDVRGEDSSERHQGSE